MGKSILGILDHSSSSRFATDYTLRSWRGHVLSLGPLLKNDQQVYVITQPVMWTRSLLDRLVNRKACLGGFWKLDSMCLNEGSCYIWQYLQYSSGAAGRSYGTMVKKLDFGISQSQT